MKMLRLTIPVLMLGLATMGCVQTGVDSYRPEEPEVLRPRTTDEILRDGLRPQKWQEGRVFVYFDPVEKLKEFRVEVEDNDTKRVWVYNPDDGKGMRPATAEEEKYGLWRLSQDVIPVHRKRSIFLQEDPELRGKMYHVYVFKGRYEVIVSGDGEGRRDANTTERNYALDQLRRHLYDRGATSKMEYYKRLADQDRIEREFVGREVADEMEETIQRYHEQVRDLQHELNAARALGIDGPDQEAKRFQIENLRAKIAQHESMRDYYLSDEWQVRREEAELVPVTRSYSLVNFNQYVNDLKVIPAWIQEEIDPESWTRYDRICEVQGDVLLVRNSEAVVRAVKGYLESLLAEYATQAQAGTGNSSQ